MGAKALLVLTIVFSAPPARAQPEDLIQHEIDAALDRALWELGPFRLRPALRAGLGYDSNAILTADSANPDVAAFFAPGLEAVIPFSDRGFARLYEELDFVYYRDLVELRDIFNVTRASGAFGGKTMVVQLDGEFRDEKVRPTRELDVPVDQRSSRLGASLDLAVGWRHGLTFSYERYRVETRDSDLTAGGVPISSLLDRTENVYELTMSRYLTEQTVALVEVFAERQDFDDKTVNRDADGYGILGGLEFSPMGNVSGEAQLGYKRLIPDSPTQLGYEGLVGNALVVVNLGQRYSLEGRFLRDTGPSVLRETVYVLTTAYGAFLNIYFNGPFSLRPGIRFGRNDYPESDFTFSDDPSSVALIRRFRAISLQFDYQMTPHWQARVGTTFSHRETSSPSAPEERFIVALGLTRVF